MDSNPQTVDDLLAAAGVPSQPRPQSVDDLLNVRMPGQPEPLSLEEQASNLQADKSIIRAGIVGASSFIPALGLAKYGMIPEIAGSTAGAFGGSLIADVAMGEKPNVKQAGKEAAINLGGAAFTRALAEAYGLAGGIAPQFTRYAGRQGPVRGFGLTMREPKPTAELDLGRAVGEAIPTSITEPRQALESILASHAQSGEKIPLDDIIAAFENAKIKNPKFPEAVKLNADIDARITALQTQQATSGGLDAVELDRLINKELDPKAFTKSGDISTQALGRPYKQAQEAAKKSLLSRLPPEAGALRDQVAEELTWRSLSRKYFGSKRPGKALVGQIKNIEQPGNEEALQALEFVSKESGIDFIRMAKDLATKRAFTADDRVKMTILNRIMLTIGAGGVVSGRPGVAAAAILANPMVARFASKFIAPLQSIGGPGGVTLYEYLRNKYAMRESPKQPQAAGSAVYSQKRINPKAAMDAFSNAMGGPEKNQ